MIPLGIGDWFSALLQPIRVGISYVLIWAYELWSKVTGTGAAGPTWTLAIISLVVLVRILLIPLFVRQINSSRRMQMIQPKMKELQDKYGSDRERLGMETQKLMRQEGVNPASSCLPLLLQMPIFFALYQVLAAASRSDCVDFPEHCARASVLRPYVGWISESQFLGARLAGKLLPLTPWGMTQTLALILIVIMTALFYITQKQLMSKNMTPAALEGPMAQSQKMMLYIFPFMYLFMGFVIQIGVLLYWVTSNLWTLGQQWLLIRNNPTPGTPAYIDWEERMIAKGKDPKKLEEERQKKLSQRPQEAKTATGKSGVQRQTVTPPPAGGGSNGPGGTRRSGGFQAPSRSRAAEESDGSGESDGETGPAGPERSGQRIQVQRQQPKKQSRAQRKHPPAKR